MPEKPDIGLAISSFCQGNLSVEEVKTLIRKEDVSNIQLLELIAITFNNSGGDLKINISNIAELFANDNWLLQNESDKQKLLIDLAKNNRNIDSDLVLKIISQVLKISFTE